MNFNKNLEKGTCQPVIITNKHVVKDAKKIIFSVCRADENNNPLDQQKFTITLDEFKIINQSWQWCGLVRNTHSFAR